MALTIDAPPSRVWSWLVQMGCDRAGWYSWDRLDNGGHASAEQIHPEWQHLSIGDRWASAPSGRSWFEVAAVDPERFLMLRAPLHLDGRPFDPAGPRPRFFSDSSWGFALTGLPGGRTRLTVSGYSASHPRVLTAIGDVVFWEPAHWIMQTRQLRNLKRRAEHQTAAAVEVHNAPDEGSTRSGGVSAMAITLADGALAIAASPCASLPSPRQSGASVRRDDPASAPDVA